MKRIALLKTITVIAFIFCIVTVVFGVPFTLMLAVASHWIPEGLKAHISATGTAGAGAVVYLLLVLGSTACVALALHTFKETLTLFEKRVFFDTRVIAQLLKTGKAFMGAALANIAAEVVDMLFASDGPHIEVSISYGPTLLFAGLGLLFMVLSDVFSNAKNLKDENDLTV